jgi:non-ribosomal peptide synthetase component E (peptide arylation enzyme)
MRAIDYFDKGAEAFPDRIAIIDGARRFSYRETQAASKRIASAMRASGLTKIAWRFFRPTMGASCCACSG